MPRELRGARQSEEGRTVGNLSAVRVAWHRLFCCYRKSVDTLIFGGYPTAPTVAEEFRDPWEAMTYIACFHDSGVGPHFRCGVYYRRW